MIYEEIDLYALAYAAGGGRRNSSLTEFKLRAIINIGRAEEVYAELLFGIDPVGMPDEDELNSGFATCHYRADDFPQVLDLLRNERPLWFVFDENWKLGFLQVGPEPVGEGEITWP